MIKYLTGHSYQLIDSYDERTGKCTTCNARVSVEQRQYRDRTVGEEGWTRVRTACLCLDEGYDPFKQAEADFKQS